MSGRWALLCRRDIPDIEHPAVTYLTRWQLVETPLFGVYLHAIRQPDSDRYLHDHPWSFVSLILRGGYVESLLGRRQRRWRLGSVHRLRAIDFHAITTLRRRPTWTLVLVGRRRRDWGYLTESGWVSHEEYHASIGLAQDRAWGSLDV